MNISEELMADTLDEIIQRSILRLERESVQVSILREGGRPRSLQKPAWTGVQPHSTASKFIGRGLATILDIEIAEGTYSFEPGVLARARSALV